MLVIEDLNKVRVGVKQTSRALKTGKVDTLFIARDAEQHVTRKIIELANDSAVSVIYIDSMVELGRLCHIDVGAATAVIIK